MSTLLIDRSDCDLDVEGDTIVLRQAGVRSGTFPVRLVDRVIVARAARFSSRALSRFSRHGIGVVVDPGRYAPDGPSVVIPSGTDGLLRIAQYDLALDPVERAALAGGFVRRRIEPARLSAEAHPDLRRRLDRAVADIEGRPTLERLRGIEGAATAAVFALFADRVPRPFVFAGRNRRPPKDPVNVLLSLGYTLAHAEALRLAAIAGLDPFLGILHETGRGRESLACDLVEVARPEVERWTLALLAGGDVGLDDFFGRGADGCRLLKDARQRVHRSFEDDARPRIQAVLDAEVRAVVAALRRRAESRPAVAALAARPPEPDDAEDRP